MQQTGENEPLATTRLDSRTGITWVWMPLGTFEQGCVPGDSECDSDEKPAIAKTVRGFWRPSERGELLQHRAVAPHGFTPSTDLALRDLRRVSGVEPRRRARDCAWRVR